MGSQLRSGHRRTFTPARQRHDSGAGGAALCEREDTEPITPLIDYAAATGRTILAAIGS